MLSANPGLSLGLNVSAWMQLSAAMTACAQVRAALSLGVLPNPPPCPPLALWRPFLVQLRALLPMIAIVTQLNLSASANLATDLSAMLRLMLQLRLPAMGSASLSLMASLTAGLSAIAQLRLSLGIDPLAAGITEVAMMVAAQLSATAEMVLQITGIPLPSLVLQLPQIAYCPTLMAPSAVVQAAMSLNLPALNWNVPAIADLPVLSLGLPVVSFAAQLNAALNLQASLSPCPICDGQALLGAALSL
jgi:hypothetical protein